MLCRFHFSEACFFQSHYGAIATVGKMKKFPSEISFNPTMVRLRRYRQAYHLSPPYFFQSHYGAIATKHGKATWSAL